MRSEPWVGGIPVAPARQLTPLASFAIHHSPIKAIGRHVFSWDRRQRPGYARASCGEPPMNANLSFQTKPFSGRLPSSFTTLTPCPSWDCERSPAAALSPGHQTTAPNEAKRTDLATPAPGSVTPSPAPKGAQETPPVLPSHASCASSTHPGRLHESVRRAFRPGKTRLHPTMHSIAISGTQTFPSIPSRTQYYKPGSRCLDRQRPGDDTDCPFLEKGRISFAASRRSSAVSRQREDRPLRAKASLPPGRSWQDG